jgi:hypothetical protein
MIVPYLMMKHLFMVTWMSLVKQHRFGNGFPANSHIFVQHVFHAIGLHESLLVVLSLLLVF